MAEIFLARMKGVAGFEKQVVIKRILPQYADDEQFVAMFLDEARIAARITHPNVCQVYELGEVDGQYYLAMEYLEGVPLTTVLRKVSKDGKLPDLRLVTALVVQACEGLHNAHELKELDGSPIGVVHRDVSPQNLFVTIDGTVKVLDFGIAKAQGASAKTRTGTVKGKYAYMSPEQLRGEALDRRSDVFALGVVLFEGVTGRRLFHRETDYLIFKAITEEPIPNVRDVRPDLPQTLAAACQMSLARNRDERMPSARSLGQSVARAMDPYGGLMSHVGVAEIIENDFADEIGKMRERIAAAVADAASPTTGSIPKVDLYPGSDVSKPRRPPSRSPDTPIARPPPMPPSMPPALTRQQQETPVGGVDDEFMPDVPEEPDESGTDVWDGNPLLAAEQAIAAERAASHEAPTVSVPEDLIRAAVAKAALDTYDGPMPAPEILEALPGSDVDDDAKDTPLVAPPAMPATAQAVPKTIPPYATASVPAVEQLRPRRSRILVIGLLAGVLGAGIFLWYASYYSGDDEPSVSNIGAGSVPASSETAKGAQPPGTAPTSPPSDTRKPVGTPTQQPPPREPRPTDPKPAAPAPADTRPQDPQPEDPKPQDPKPQDPKPQDPKPQDTRPADRPPIKRPEKPEKREPGFFTIDSTPYATIYIDGRKQGETPLFKISLSPGTHRLKAVSPTGKVQTGIITIESGKDASRKLKW